MKHFKTRKSQEEKAEVPENHEDFLWLIINPDLYAPCDPSRNHNLSDRNKKVPEIPMGFLSIQKSNCIPIIV
jgi:hypothetical protein